MLRKYLLNLDTGISPDGIPSGGAIDNGPDAGSPPDTGSDNAIAQAQPPVPNSGTPPKLDDAEEGEEPFSMDNFNAIKNGTALPEKPKEDDKPNEEKPDDKKEDKVVKPEDKVDDKKAPTIPAPVSKVDKADARDYSDIPEEDKPIFKKMGNEAFAKFKPIYLAEKAKTKLLEEKEVALAEAKKGGLPDNYFENPEAYIFDPEYKQAEYAVNTVNGVVNHWRQQMTLIEQGKEWQDLTYDETKKQFVLSGPQPSNPENRINVFDAYQNAINQKNLWTNKRDSIRSAFASKHQEVNEAINQLTDSCFPTFKDEKSEHHLIAKDVESKLPPFIRRSPLKTILTRSMAVNVMLSKQLSELKKNGGAKTTTTNGKGPSDSKRKAGPTDGDMGASNGGNGNEPEFTMEDYERIKNMS